MCNPKPFNIIEAAVKNGHLEILKFMHERGYDMNSDDCTLAARCGQLKVLKWAVIDVGCEWDLQACREAASVAPSVAYAGLAGITTHAKMAEFIANME
jgi:hypothetical protein